jgi:hypothetical protein
MTISMKNGDVIRFKTTGYEIADVRNPNPAKEWTGYVIGGPSETHVVLCGPSETHVVLWCKRERREATAVCVALENIINNETSHEPRS